MSNTTFPYKIAAIDLDDTLLGPDKQVSAGNVTALRRLQEHGVRIVLASGRRHENMFRFHRQLDLEGPIISCQGALTRNAETDEILHKHLMDADLAADIIVDGEAQNITQMVYQLDATYTHERTPYTDMYEFRTASITEKVGDLRRFVGTQPQKIIWVCEAEEADRMLPIYQARYAGRLEVLISDPEYLEFMAHGVSKAIGLAAVAAYYGVEQAHTLAFGDGNNDVTMIRWAGLGTAMDHARPSAIAAADFVAPPGDPETSFARAVDALLAKEYANGA